MPPNVVFYFCFWFSVEFNQFNFITNVYNSDWHDLTEEWRWIELVYDLIIIWWCLHLAAPTSPKNTNTAWVGNCFRVRSTKSCCLLQILITFSMECSQCVWQCRLCFGDTHLFSKQDNRTRKMHSQTVNVHRQQEFSFQFGLRPERSHRTIFEIFPENDF